MCQTVFYVSYKQNVRLKWCLTKCTRAPSIVFVVVVVVVLLAFLFVCFFVDLLLLLLLFLSFSSFFVLFWFSFLFGFIAFTSPSP